ncbi:DUF202 domain-containing protein, partial [Microbacterium maritypicum]
VVGVGTACVLWVAARRRQRRATAVLTGSAAGALPGGALLLLLTVFATGFGAIAVIFVAVALPLM